MFLHCSVFLRPDKEKNVNIVLLYGQAIGYKKHLSLFYVLTNEKHQHHTFRWAIGNHFLQSIWRKLAIILYRVFRENQDERWRPSHFPDTNPMNVKMIPTVRGN